MKFMDWVKNNSVLIFGIIIVVVSVVREKLGLEEILKMLIVMLL